MMIVYNLNRVLAFFFTWLQSTQISPPLFAGTKLVYISISAKN